MKYSVLTVVCVSREIVVRKSLNVYTILVLKVLLAYITSRLLHFRFTSGTHCWYVVDESVSQSLVCSLFPSCVVRCSR